ncbi:MAG: TldD/PmbA family protein [Holosporaceae bacterium]|jgi:PmbA protein|nr:TldD/PmbA family protein [Holosporaceae bacterium]
MNSEILSSIITKAKKSGADQVDVLCKERNTISASTRLKKLKKIVQADVISIKMRVSIGNRSAVVTTDNPNDLDGDSFLEKALLAARNAPEDAVIFRPVPNELCKNFRSMDICDNYRPSSEELISTALECETIALQIAGITNSEGAEASHSYSKITLANNNDFFATYEQTNNLISLVTLAEKDGFLETAYDFSKTIYWSDLKSPERIAQKAAELTLKKLGAKKIPSCKVPIVFDRIVSQHLLTSLVDAINGAAVAKGISFLKDKLSKKIFSHDLSIVDEYAIPRGLRSYPFDSDGLECSDVIILENGILRSFLLNTRYAHQLKMKSTAHAFGFEGIAPHNIYIKNGKESFQSLLRTIKKGLYVTEVLGNGLNLITGNYSQGVAGFWIENGEITYPVNEITIAGNFIDMLSNCVPASDLEIEYGVDAPTLFLDEMIVGGM